MFKVWNGQLSIAIGGSHMLLWCFFGRFHRYSGGILPVFRLLWLLGRRTARPPPATERTIRLWNGETGKKTECWMLIHVFQTFFSRFVRYSYLSRRYSGVRCSVSWAVWRRYLYLSRRFSDVFKRYLYFLSTVHGHFFFNLPPSDTVWRKYLDGGRRNR